MRKKPARKKAPTSRARKARRVRSPHAAPAGVTSPTRKAGRRTEAKRAMTDASKGNHKSEKNSARSNGAAKEQPSKVKFESVLAREEAVSYFEALIEGLRKGTIQLRQGADTITLKPGPQVAIEVKAGRKNEKEKISFEIAWRTEAAATADLKISAS